MSDVGDGEESSRRATGWVSPAILHARKLNAAFEGAAGKALMIALLVGLVAAFVAALKVAHWLPLAAVGAAMLIWQSCEVAMARYESNDTAARQDRIAALGLVGSIATFVGLIGQAAGDH